MPALNLYGGDHWVIAKSLINKYPNLNVNLWITSPGYGLINANDLITPYHATFSPNHPESVLTDHDLSLSHANRNWWNLLQHWQPKGIHGPRSIAELASINPKNNMLIIGSARYMQLLRDDLSALFTIKSRHLENLYIISSGSNVRSGPLSANLLPSDQRLRQILGGGDTSLNIRVARLVLQLLSDGKTGFRTVESILREILEGIPNVPPVLRRKVTDIEISTFISNLLSEDRKVSKTYCLQQIRAQGIACQEKRFKRIFLEVTTSHADIHTQEIGNVAH